MDLQKEREAFEAWFKSLNENGRTTYFLGQESKVSWEAWQAAKAQAVPDGFVLVPKEPTDAMLIKGNRLALADKGYRYDATSIWEAMIEAQEQKG